MPSEHRARNWALILVPCALTVFLALTPFIPFTRPIWKLNNPVSFYAVLACFVGVDFAILYAALSLLLLANNGDTIDELNAIRNALPTASIRPLTDGEFYDEFLSAAKSATSIVRIAYLSPTPPLRAAPRDREKYYSEIADLVRRRENVQFFRLIRRSDANLEWIVSFIRDFDGVSNMSVALIDDAPEAKPSSIGLSVQIVDDKQSWLVALDGHERRGRYRDIAVDNPLFADGMTKYYERLWDLGAEILRNGQPTTEGKRLASRFAKR